MESEGRPHFRTSSIGNNNNNNSSHSALSTTSTNASAAAANELFTCFATRLSSSSSMKLTKSFLSPARSGAARDGSSVSLSSSLSRRLRPNGSLKAAGQASPFFGKRKGCAFENPEPSSPKVTCIGQVRVKTKKKVRGQQSRSLSKREVSFRKMESDGNNCGGGIAHYVNQESLAHKNQRWVHLPVSICKALRDFSCFFPCSSGGGGKEGSSSCFGKEKCVEKESAGGCGDERNGCGAVFTRWLVSVNDGENGRSRKIELVVGGGDEGEGVIETSAARVSMRSSRRHVFEDIEVKDDVIEVKGRSFDDGDESEARVSICIPPKNALLLMRCRSDPVKMAALVNRFSWDAAARDVEDDEDEEFAEEKGEESAEMVGSDDKDKEEEMLDLKDDEDCLLPEEQEGLCIEEIEAIAHDSVVVEGEEEEEEVESNMSSFEALLDQENTVEDCSIQYKEQKNQPSSSSASTEESEEEDCLTEAHSPEKSSPVQQDSSPAEKAATFTCNIEQQNPEKKISQLQQETSPGLPECLLLMMCEPKLSMEVSKETWVCSTDFLRWLPERPRKPARSSNCCHQQLPDCPVPAPARLTELREEAALSSTEREEDAKLSQKEEATVSKEHAHDRARSLLKERVPREKSKQRSFTKDQKPRSSCTLPVASMAKVIEHKLVNAVGYEPFVLTRCKSEPMRTAAAKLMPPHEPCFWKNAVVGKMEPPHRRASALGVGGATGVGF